MKITITIDRDGVATEFMGELMRFVGMMRDAAKRAAERPVETAPTPDRQEDLIARRVAMRANLRDLGFCPCTECVEYALCDRHGGVASDGSLRPGMKAPGSQHSAEPTPPPTPPDGVPEEVKS